MSKKLWGGRFAKKTNPLVEEFTKSIQFDKKLAAHDCLGSLAHIDVLKKARLLSAAEHKKLRKGLEGILIAIKKGDFKVDESFEDIHSYIQAVLEKKAGKAAFKLHTSRSRNDQVVFDVKCYSLGSAEVTMDLIEDLMGALDSAAGKNKKSQIAGYTHMQHAIPVKLSDYFSAYSGMLARDLARLKNAAKGIDLTMGSGALAGTSIDAAKYNVSLGYCKVGPAKNSIDTVSDRDFVVEILSALAITGMHLSRLAEDLILWSTKEFDFIDIDDAFCTGSSLMPQKKNPDVLELVRGNAGKLYGNLMSVLVMMKGLPLAYNRDMQLDKEPLFSSFETVQMELKVLAELLPKVKFKKENIDKQLADECLYATDMADYLVRNGVAFKEAHSIIGKLVSYKLKSGKEIADMANLELKAFHPSLNHSVMKKLIDPVNSVMSKKSARKR
ncbi:MAG: argininosuccinate lyase [Candidatus Omnitrophota bacterium]